MPPNFATEGIIIMGEGSGVCIDDPQLISGFFHRTDIKVSDGSKLRRNNVGRKMERGGRRGGHSPRRLLVNYSTVQFCRRCSNVCRLSRSIRPRKSVDRSEDDSIGFKRRVCCFGNFLEKVLSINLRKGGERGSKFSFREARLHPSIKVVSFGSLPSVR